MYLILYLFLFVNIFRVAYIEIYNETVKDLFSIEKDQIKIHETLNGIKVDVTEKVTSSPEEVLEAMKLVR